jgi:hypothetical protein
MRSVLDGGIVAVQEEWGAPKRALQAGVFSWSRGLAMLGLR